jgi:hypothetical protein
MGQRSNDVAEKDGQMEPLKEECDMGQRSNDEASRIALIMLRREEYALSMEQNTNDASSKNA